MAEIPASLAKLFLISQEAEFAHAVCHLEVLTFFPTRRMWGMVVSLFPLKAVFKVLDLLGAVVGGHRRAPALKDAAFLVLAPSGCLCLTPPFKTGWQKRSPAALPRRSGCFQIQFLKRALRIKGGASSSCCFPLNLIWSCRLSLKPAFRPHPAAMVGAVS